ncbi:MAG: hypothetical protein HYY18_21290 [Planctomycetes bacterium]|nr:hypothetical protein [Planctomycetota bacterium]
MRGVALAFALAAAGCASTPPENRTAPATYRDAFVDFHKESDAMLRFAGRNRLRVEGCAGRARAALGSMQGLLAAEPAARLASLSDRFGSFARTIAADNALSSGQELAVNALRDEIARDFAPERVEVVSRGPEPPRPPEPGAFARWEAAHARFAEAARGGGGARVVQEYSEVRAAMEGMAATDEDRYRVERFLREYERLAELLESGKAMEQDLKGIPVLEADIRASFGEKK